MRAKGCQPETLAGQSLEDFLIFRLFDESYTTKYAFFKFMAIVYFEGIGICRLILDNIIKI
jgi:hypothetical protein